MSPRRRTSTGSPGRSAVDESSAPLTSESEHPLLQRVVEEAARLVRVDGAMLYLLDAADGALHLARDAGVTDGAGRAWLREIRVPVGVGVIGRAVAEAQVIRTGDYAHDRSFPHQEPGDYFVVESGVRSAIAAPLIDDGAAFGALSVVSTRPNAFGEADAGLVRALADHAAAAMTNARLIEQLARSRTDLQRRADRERALREMAAGLVAIRDAGALLRQAVGSAVQLVGADWAEIAEVDAGGRIRWAYDAGIRAPGLRRRLQRLELHVGEGLLGRAVAERRVVVTGDYLGDMSFDHVPTSDAFARRVGFQSLVGAPIVIDGVAAGVLAVHANRRDAFTDDDVALIGAFADQAAVAVGNARLIEELARSRSELARRADEERALREIATRVSSLRRPEEVLQYALDEAVRLLRADAGRIEIIDPIAQRLQSLYTSSPGPEDMSALWEGGNSAGVDQGVAGKAVLDGGPFVTDDYLEDTRFSHHEGADESIRRSGIRSVMAAPLGGSGPYDALLLFARRPSAWNADDAELLGALATQVSIAVANARLYRRLEESEAQYRYLVKASPDVVWAVDESGSFTFMSDRIEQLTGHRPDEVIGRHFEVLTLPASMPASLDVWQAVQRDPTGVYPLPILMPQRSGASIPVEIWVTGMVRDGRFAGAHGSIRDMRERERLDEELRRQAAELAAGEERAHLARELHDSVTQALFSMTLVTRSIELLLPRNPAEAAKRLETLRDLQRDALAEMRALIFELRPASLEKQGLVPALRTHVAALQGRTGLPVILELAEIGRLPQAVESALFRITQEALNNILKHAGNSRVRVVLWRGQGGVRLTIEDDGIGFDPATVAEDRLGLAGMRARAERIGAELSIRSAPGRGTRVEVQVPVQSELEE